MFRNYPRGYGAVFWTEFWGNFSFYGLRSVLILYLGSQFLFRDQKAFELYGVFMALAYLTPVLGGWLADQIFGVRRAVLIGSIFVSLGCVALSFPYESFCFSGLALVSIGSGFFKPTIVSSVGHLFSKKEAPLQDSAYTTFYVGMSLGSFTAAAACGWLGETFGWGRVFPLVALTMLLGGWIFYRGIQNQENFEPPQSNTLPKTFLAWGGILLLLPLIYLALAQSDSMQWVLPLVIIGSGGCLLSIFLKSTTSERKDVLKIGLLMVLFSVFCSLFEQTGSSVTLFIERGVDRTFFDGFTLPTPFFQSFIPACVIILSPPLAVLWRKLAAQGKDPSIFGKFALGFLFVSLNYWIFVFAIELTPSQSLVSPYWVLLGYMIHVIGDLCIVPIGFAAVSKLAPKRFSNLIMGLWMLSIASGHYVASLLAKLSSIPCSSEEIGLHSALETYQIFFTRIAIIPLVTSLLTFSILICRALYKKRVLNKQDPS